MSAATAVFTFADGVRQVGAGALSAQQAADRLLDQLSDAELLSLLDGDVPLLKMILLPSMIRSGPIPAGVVPRLGIPGVQFSDGPRGVVIGESTSFPVTMMRGATWDPALEERVGLAMGLEARAQGANYSGAVCVNLLRHPAWGRAQECYGEDPVLTGQMGAGLTKGLQRNVMACVKHFALNSMENSRFRVDVMVDEHALHEVYLPHFKTVVDAGVDSVMTAYNSVNGTFAGENKVLMTDILRAEWGFEGFTTSDWAAGVHEGVVGLEAGLDIEMPLRMHRKKELPSALRSGLVPRELVRESGRRILATTIRRYVERDQAVPTPEVVAGLEHRALAREVAVRGAVLLTNALVGGLPVLPLPASIARLAVLGPLADEPNTGDHGSSLVHPPTTCSVLQGLREALPGVEIVHLDGSDVAASIDAARAADAVVVVAGMGFEDEGERIQDEDGPGIPAPFPLSLLELPPLKWLVGKLVARFIQFGRGGDRDVMTLHPTDEELIIAVAEANPRTAVVVVGGSAILMEAWRSKVPAILMAWYAGMEGGRAIADVLTGDQEPGGRLPVSIPVDAAHLPFFDAAADRIVYDSHWGQRLLDEQGHQPAFPFGFGLSYTTFDLELLTHTRTEATVRVLNTGARAGSTVVQIYAVDTDTSRPVPQLIGFQRVRLSSGGDATVTVALDLTPTLERDPNTRQWHPRRGRWQVVTAAHSPSTFHGAQDLSSA